MDDDYLSYVDMVRCLYLKGTFFLAEMTAVAKKADDEIAELKRQLKEKQK